ncbi:MAG TPA: glycosyl hydrolase [Clostridia bacterium]|mgnify:FL=1|nr:glycosyl hydrolase [Clostridia bacterium]
MVRRIHDCLNAKEDRSYIFPFLWLHGEEHDRLVEEIDAVYKSGIREICFESRPYADFCGDKWWEDFAFMLEQARQRDMRVWLLDDKHFPSGYANGAIEKKYPHLRRKCVRIECLDVAGPVIGSAFIADRYDKNTEELISVSSYRRTGKDEEVDGSTGVLLTNNVQNGLVYWDVPEGVWRVFFVIKTQRGPAHFKNYIDMCDEESCKVMIKEIYEPHYERFGKYFGNTFRGFFSDEPCFANNIGSYYDTLGIPSLILPWRNDMIEMLAERANLSADEAELLLPCLWYTVAGKTSQLRYAYMETVSHLYRDNFSRMVGNWCRERGVLYIGHVIEDMNTHMRLGYGAGHFFRAQDGQDMSGIDVVLHQILPGITDMLNKSSSSRGVADPEFFINTLPKLGASCAHLDPKKKNRAMVELYGAYGFAEGLPVMKYLTDLMLAGGINHFVPHAFTAKDNDPDCPPHFYANGRNPQFPLFRLLMEYLQRASHVLYGGVHVANAAVFYNAEGEWCGGKYRLFQDVATNLAKEQIDFDIVSIDALVNATVKDKKLIVNEEKFDALVISYSEVLPKKLLDICASFSSEGLSVVFTEDYPDRTEKNFESEEELNAIREHTRKLVENCIVVPTDKVAAFFREKGFVDVELKDTNPFTRVLHLSEDDGDAYFFFNLSMEKDVDTKVFFKNNRFENFYEYDIWNNKVYKCQVDKDGIRLVLPKGHATLLFACSDEFENAPTKQYDFDFKKLNITFDVYLIEHNSKTYYGKMESDALKNLAFEKSGFCGVIRYEGKIETDAKVKFLNLGIVGEIAQLYVNDTFCGTCISHPYIFDVSNTWETGENSIVIEVTTNPGYMIRDNFSRMLPLPPMGLLGPVEISR